MSNLEIAHSNEVIRTDRSVGWKNLFLFQTVQFTAVMYIGNGDCKWIHRIILSIVIPPIVVDWL